MKFRFFLFLLVPGMLLANEINPKLHTKKVTVYLSGAQLTNEANFSIPQGRTVVLFSDLSPNIDPNSIQISGLGDVTIASLNYRINYLEKQEETEKLKNLQSLKKIKGRKLALISNHISGLQQEKELLIENMQINTSHQSVPIDRLKEYAAYYRTRIAEIETEIYDASQSQIPLQNALNDLQKEINKYERRNSEERGMIELLLDAPAQSALDLMVSYNVSNAGWFPTYDIKTKNTDNPLLFYYKANVHQETGNDWEHVSLTLSTGDPGLNTEKPTLGPYYLNFIEPFGYSQNRKIQYHYNPSIHKVSGKVLSSRGMPLAGVNVIVEGTNRGTVTDLNGNYSIKIFNGKKLSYSYVGFKDVSLPIYDHRMNVSLHIDTAQLEQVIAVGYGEVLQGKTAGTKVEKIPPVIKTENIMTTMFKITDKYSIPSSSETTIVAIDEFSLPATYEYYTAPLLRPEVFLTAHVTDWENFDLLPGEAKIYFDGNFAGTTTLRPQQIDNEMVISFGVDPEIVVERERINNLKDKSFFGNTRIINRDFEISLKNNKSVPVQITLLDRIPVSQNNEIEVDDLDYGSANYNDTTGIVTWKVKLAPKGTEKLELSYEINYPKNRRINLN